MGESSGYTEDQVLYTMTELCRTCRLDEAYIEELIAHGIIEPQHAGATVWRFSATEVSRTRRAWRLQQDLELNLEGVALAMELMEKNRRLRERVRFLEQLLERLHE